MKVKLIVAIALLGAVASAVAADPRFLKGDEVTAYRDPAALWHDGIFHVYFTLVETDSDMTIHSYVAHVESTDLKTWTKPVKITPKSVMDYSSPGNVVRDGDDWVLCYQSYPRPGNVNDGKIRYGNETARLFTARSKDLRRWSEPELIRVKGPDVAEKDMGRMIDPYLIRDDAGVWRCFYKQAGGADGRMGACFSQSADLKTWECVGRTEAGENVCVVKANDRYLMMHSPANGLGLKTSTDLVHWHDVPGRITLDQDRWPWARGRLTAGCLLDARMIPGFGKWLLFFHGSGPKDEASGDFDRNASLAVVPFDLDAAHAEAPYAFRADLERVHRPGLRAVDASVAPGEYAVRDGFAIAVPADATDFVRRVAVDFTDFLSVSMGVDARVVRNTAQGDMTPVIDSSLPERQYRVDVASSGITVCGHDERALAQAFYHLEDLMSLRRGPFLKLGKSVRTPRFAVRMTHSGYKLSDFPDAHLNAMAHAGMTAIMLFVNDIDKVEGTSNMDISAAIRRAKAFGLDTYLYSSISTFIHPDDGEAVFDETYGRVAGHYPEAKGLIIVGESCQFPSKDPRVQPRAYRNRDKNDKRPLAGWFPCADYADWVVAVQKALRKKAPDMRLVFWTYNWGWAPEEDRLKLIDSLPQDVILQATFEMFERQHKRNGITSPTADYSLSFPGPGRYFASEGAAAKRRGLALFTQANAGGRTWDFGTAPIEPCPFLWQMRWQALVKAHEEWGLSGIMENHHYGWSPTFLSELEKEVYTEGGLPFEEHVKLIAERDFGRGNADKAIAAWKRWSRAMEDYVPTDLNQYGPFRCGPAYPYAAGRGKVDRKTFPTTPQSLVGSNFIRMDYITHGFVPELTKEDSSVPYMEKEIELLDGMIADFSSGADLFASMSGKPAADMTRLGRYLAACCRTARNVKRGAIAEAAKDEAAILVAAKDEYANAQAALILVEADSHLGWEPDMDYVGGPDQIRWKIALMEALYGASLR